MHDTHQSLNREFYINEVWNTGSHKSFVKTFGEKEHSGPVSPKRFCFLLCFLVKHLVNRRKKSKRNTKRLSFCCARGWKESEEGRNARKMTFGQSATLISSLVRYSVQPSPRHHSPQNPIDSPPLCSSIWSLSPQLMNEDPP